MFKILYSVKCVTKKFCKNSEVLIPAISNALSSAKYGVVYKNNTTSCGIRQNTSQLIEVLKNVDQKLDFNGEKAILKAEVFINLRK